MKTKQPTARWDYGYYHADGDWVSLLGLVMCGHEECHNIQYGPKPDFEPCGIADDYDGGYPHWKMEGTDEEK